MDAIGFSMGANLLHLRVAAADPSRLWPAGGSVASAPQPVSRRVTLEAATGPSRPAAETAEGDPAVAQAFATLRSRSRNDHGGAGGLHAPGVHSIDPADLARIDLPVLVVLGDQDFVGPADELLAALPNARYRLPLRRL